MGIFSKLDEHSADELICAAVDARNLTLEEIRRGVDAKMFNRHREVYERQADGDGVHKFIKAFGLREYAVYVPSRLLPAELVDKYKGAAKPAAKLKINKFAKFYAPPLPQQQPLPQRQRRVFADPADPAPYEDPFNEAGEQPDAPAVMPAGVGAFQALNDLVRREGARLAAQQVLIRQADILNEAIHDDAFRAVWIDEVYNANPAAAPDGHREG